MLSSEEFLNKLRMWCLGVIDSLGPSYISPSVNTTCYRGTYDVDIGYTAPKVNLPLIPNLLRGTWWTGLITPRWWWWC